MKRYCIVSLACLLILALVLGGCASSTPSSSPASSSAAPPPSTTQSSAPPATSSTTAPTTTSPSSTQAATKPIELSLNLPIPPTHNRWIQLLKPWTEELTKRTNGRVVVQPYFAEALSPMPQNYKSVVNGIADMAECTMDPQIGQFPLLGTMFYLSTPSVYVSNTTQLITELLNDFPVLQEELKDVKVIGLEGSDQNNIGTTKKPVKTLADLKGLKLNVVGGGLVADRLKALGISAQGLGMGDVYTALDKGVVDGTMCSMDILIGRRWGDSIKYVTPVNLSSGTFYFVMNKDKWNSLPPDIQKIIDDMSGDYFIEMANKFWVNADVSEYHQWVDKMGGKVTYLSADDLATLDKEVEPVTQAYVSEMDKKGYPYTQIYQKYLELEKKYSAPWPY